MLSIRKSEKHQGKCLPNVLPCGIKHDGPVDTSKRYWAPSKAEGMHLRGESWRPTANTRPDGKNIAYFHGRKLQGSEVKLPDGYTGVVLAPKVTSNGDKMYDNDDEGDRIEETVSEELAHFDRVMVWDHGALPDGSSDPYLRGIDEWISFAETVCNHDAWLLSPI